MIITGDILEFRIDPLSGFAYITVGEDRIHMTIVEILPVLKLRVTCIERMADRVGVIRSSPPAP